MKDKELIERRKRMRLCIDCGALLNKVDPKAKSKIHGKGSFRCEACRTKYQPQKTQSMTLCWQCKHAVPKIYKNRYVKGCEWSIKRLPVIGWDAETKILRVTATDDCISYNVKSCPKFEKGR